MMQFNRKSGSSDKKEGIMKTAILTIGILVLFSMAQITTMAVAQQSGNHGAFISAMAISSLAEKEIREDEKRPALECAELTAMNTAIADDKERATNDVEKE